jgi:hypothetical protein
MADKKVGRSGRERPLTPTQKMKAALSDSGTLNTAEATHDKGKSALVDRFREREEQWRRKQALHDQEAAREAEQSRLEAMEASDAAEQEDRGQGGDS